MAKWLNRVKGRKKHRHSKCRNLQRREQLLPRAKERAQPDLEGDQTQGDELIAWKNNSCGKMARGGGGEISEPEVKRSVQTRRKPVRAVEGGNTEEELRPPPAAERHLGQRSRLPPLQTTEDQRSIDAGSWHVWTCNVLISSLVVCSPVLTTRKSRAWCRL